MIDPLGPVGVAGRLPLAEIDDGGRRNLREALWLVIAHQRQRTGAQIGAMTKRIAFAVDDPHLARQRVERLLRMTRIHLARDRRVRYG